MTDEADSTAATTIPTGVNWDGLIWLDDAREVATDIQLGDDTVMSCLSNPQRRVIDASAVTKGYPIVRYIRGDVMVVVGFKAGPESPAVMAVYRLSEGKHGRRAHATAAGSGSGGTGPRSYRDLSKRILAMGYRIQPGGVHPKVVTKDGIYVYTLPSTASDNRSLDNSWAGFLRAAEEIPPTAEEP